MLLFREFTLFAHSNRTSNYYHTTKMKSLYIFLLTIAIAISVQFTSFAQSSPPPPPGHGQSGNQPAGGGAPIGHGAGLLLLMASGYGLLKIYNTKRNPQE